MTDQEILYALLDFEINWNKYHLIKNKGYIFRIQKLNDVFTKLEILDSNYTIVKTADNNTKLKYNFIKTGHFLNFVPEKFLEGVQLRIKKIIKSSTLKNKYPHFFDFDFDYPILFNKFFSLRCFIYKLETMFNNENQMENVELDIEDFFCKKMLFKIKDDVQELDSILYELLNPYNKIIHDEKVLHHNIDFNNIDIY